MTAVVDTAEEGVLRAVVAGHSAALLGYALRSTNGDRGQAEDIVQETFVRAWRAPKALGEERGPLRLAVHRRPADLDRRAPRA